MATINCFEELDVWQQARTLSRDIYRLTTVGSFAKDFELKNQINRASGSVMDNIAEGFGRPTRPALLPSLGSSSGSVTEVKSQLYRSLDREHLSPHVFDEYYNRADRIGTMIFGLIQALKRSPVRGLKYRVGEQEAEYSLPEFE